MAPPEDVCAFEFIFAGSTPWAIDMVKAYYKALRAQLGEDIWIHWGQLVTGADAHDIAATYRRYPAWRAIRDEFDPDQRFLNAWQKEMLSYR
jgi:FAD/FMN-containing dehydrogenase